MLVTGLKSKSGVDAVRNVTSLTLGKVAGVPKSAVMAGSVGAGVVAVGSVGTGKSVSDVHVIHE